jgi:hypothetical protein
MIVGECEVAVEEIEGGFVVVVVEGVNGSEESYDGGGVDCDREFRVGWWRAMDVG